MRTVVQLFSCSTIDSVCLKTFLKVNFRFLCRFLFWPRWVRMLSFKYDNHDGPLFIKRCINYFLYIAVKVNHVWRKRLSISKVCMSYIINMLISRKTKPSPSKCTDYTFFVFHGEDDEMQSMVNLHTDEAQSPGPR